MKKIFSFFLASLVVSCFVVKAQEALPITVKLKKSDLEGNYSKLSDVADEISYIKLETHPDGLIGSASRYYVKKLPHAYIIWSAYGSGTIMMFNSDGKFKGIVGGEGKGPGEYYGVYKVVYDRYLDNILVLLGKKVFRYDMTGKFISSVDIETNNSRIERMCVKDDHKWLFTYKKPLQESLFEVGVLATNKEGEIIKQYNLTDEKSPGSYSYHTQKNYLYQKGTETYYNPYDHFHTYKLNRNDQWEPFITIDAPFKKTPIDLFKGHNPMKLDEVRRENGQLLSAFISGNYMMIRGAAPKTPVFDILVGLKSENRYKYTFDKGFSFFGFTNDLDGGLPFNLNRFDSDGIAVRMIDAVKLLDSYEKGLLKPDGKDHGPYLNLKEVIESTELEDNPVIIVVHIKK